MQHSASARQQLNVAALNVNDYVDAEAIDAILKIPPPGNKALLAQVVGSFRESTIQTLSELRGLVLPHEIIIKSAALGQKLKSSAIVAGARNLTRLAAELEAAAKEAKSSITSDYIIAQCEECDIELEIYTQLMDLHYRP